MEQSLLLNTKHIPYNHTEDKQELTQVLKQARELNEIQSELASIIDIQDNDVKHINMTLEDTYDTSVSASSELQQATAKKFRMTPILIGSVLGGVLTLPLTLGLGGAGAIIGYAAGGGVLLGGIAGKKLA